MPPSNHCPQCSAPILSTTGQSRYCSKCRLPLFPIAEKYQLLRKIGEGGGGVVFLARHLHLQLNALRVVKFLHLEKLRSEAAIKEFAREIEVTSALSQNNEHIVRIYDDFGSTPKLGLFYVMEFLRGTTLAERLSRHPGGLSLELALHIFEQLCVAVRSIHRAKMVHRDLKPQNIFLIQRDDNPTFVKVMDFGIVHLMTSSDPYEKNRVVGTPMYMAPEQLQGRNVDERSDIYALGLILYEMLTGTLPFHLQEGNSGEASMLELMSARVFSPPRPLHHTLKGYPENLSKGLEEIVMQALEREPEQRFQTVTSFLKAVQALGWSADRGSAFHSQQLPTASASIEHMTLAWQKAERQSRRNMFIALFLGGIPLALLGVGLLLVFSSQRGQPSIASRTKQRTPPKLSKPPATPAPTPPKARPNKRMAAKKRPAPIQRVARRHRKPHKRTRRRLRRRPMRRFLVLRIKPKKAPQTPGCPPDPSSGRWLFFSLVPAQARVTSQLSLFNKAGGFCVLQPKGRSVRLRITHHQHQPCSFERRFRKRVLKVKLKQTTLLALDGELDYCLK